MIYICLSFDYELFLGKNYFNYEDVLLNPTSKIISVLKENNVTGTFFVDICSYMFFKKYQVFNYQLLFEKQIEEMINNNQDVQLHIHTNWESSSFDGKNITISSDNYNINDYYKNYKIDIISKGKFELEKLINNLNKDYSCIAYRAGGFCIQPEKLIVNKLVNSNILIDSSIAPLLYSNKTINKYDFRRVPQKKNWFFNEKSGIEKEACEDPKIFEVPIATTNFNILSYIKVGYKNTRLKATNLKGEYCDAANNKRNNKIKSIIVNLFGNKIMSLDSQNYLLIYENLKRLKKSSNDYYISIIAHPKLFDDIRINNLQKLIQIIKKDDSLKIVSINEIKNMVLKNE